MLGYLDRPLAVAIMTNSERGDRIFERVLAALRQAYS
jgi:hypothetical protein